MVPAPLHASIHCAAGIADAAQTRGTLENLHGILAAAGCTRADVVEANVWLKGPRDFPAMNRVYLTSVNVWIEWTEGLELAASSPLCSCKGLGATATRTGLKAARTTVFDDQNRTGLTCCRYLHSWSKHHLFLSI